jgi:hypothetical protein
VSNGLPRDPYDAVSFAIIQALAVKDSVVYAGTYYGVFSTTNHGASWRELNVGLTYLNVSALAVQGTILFAGTNGGGLFRSTDSGSTWNRVGADSLGSAIRAITCSGSHVFVASGDLIGISADSGSTWRLSDPGPSAWDIWSLASSNSQLFAGTYNGGMFVSDDYAMNWRAINEGLQFPIFQVFALAISHDRIFAAITSSTSTVWSRPRSQIVASSHFEASNAPIRPQLQHNYPNPFNSATNITFTLGVQDHVTLEIFSLLGERIATLFAGNLFTGDHRFVWNPQHVAGGTYYCRLRTSSFVKTTELTYLP